MPDLVTVQLDAVAALAARLDSLGAELAADTALTRGSGTSLGDALTGPAAGELAGTGAAWSALLDALSVGTGSVATTLTQAVAAYRALDAALDALVAQRVSGRYGLAAVAA